jgi:two-component system phosphate regulon sensor histidine kinase PhoR
LSRISFKLRLAPLWPALAAVALAGALLAALLPPLFERSAAGQLLDGVAVLQPAVAARLDGPRGELQRWLAELAAGSNLRVTVIRADGVVIGDSDRTPAEVERMENHAGRPEVAAALAGGAGGSGWSVRRSATTGRTYVYAARAFDAGAGRHVLRLAEPLDRVAEVRGRLATALGLALVAALAVTLGVGWWLGRRLFRPLDRLIEGAEQLAAGRYDHRLAVPDAAELAALAGSLNRLAGSVEEQIAAVGAERDLLSSILSSMSEGVLVVDREGRALLANPAFRRLFGLRGEVEGRLPIELARHPEIEEVLDAALTAAGTVNGAPAPPVKAREIEVLSPRRRTVALAAVALASEGGGAVVVARDTSELQRLTAMRRDFVANVSHELKTPLAAIRGYAETLADGAMAEPDTARRFTARILEQCRRLQALLDDLLTLSRLESVEVPQEREPVELGPLIEREIELLAPAAQERRVAVGFEPAAGVPPLLGDPAGLGRLVGNLLDNAIKYNRPGGRVTVRLAAEPDGVRLEVADTGIGIPGEALPRIFERFYRVDKGRARDEGGTGLGLAIVKHAALAHGGRVEVDSTAGEGTVFRVHLPTAGSLTPPA